MFVGKTNLSLENAVSDSLYKLIEESIKIGQAHPNENPKALYPKMSRSTFTKLFIDQGLKLYEKRLNDYKTLKNIALAIDAGKEGHKSYLDILITNSLHPLKPLIYKAIEFFDGTLDSYTIHIGNTIVDLQSQGFNVAGIVADGLRVQSKAIAQVQEHLNGTFIKIPCACHCLNLAIQDFMKNLDDSMSCKETFSQIFNSRPIVSRLKISCPKRCITRWNNIFDICSWIVIHYD